mgnify:FL=1
MVLAAAMLLAFGALSAAVLYYVESPGRVKALIEQSLSRATGTECSIRELTYSLNPLFLHARGIELIDHTQWFYLEIPEAITELSLQGPFTRRTLVVNRLTLKDFSLNTCDSPRFGEMTAQPASAGFPSRVMRKLVGLLLFQDIRIDAAEVSGGHVNSELGDQILSLSGITARLNEEKSVSVACYGRLRSRSEQIFITMPNIEFLVDRAISIRRPEIRGFLKSEYMTISTPLGHLENLSSEVKAVYDQDSRVVTFPSVRLDSENLTLKSPSGSATPPLKMHLSAEGFVDLFRGIARAQPFHLKLNDVMEATGAVQAETRETLELNLNGLAAEMNLRSLWSMLPNLFELNPSFFSLAGVAQVSGRLTGRLKENFWQWDGDLQTRLAEAEVSLAATDLRGSGRVAAEIHVKGAIPAVETALTFTLDRADFAWKGMEVKSASASLSASGMGLDFELRNVTLQAPQVTLLLAGKRYQPHDLKAQLPRGEIHEASRRIDFPKIEIHSSWIRNLQLSAKVQDGETALGLEGKEVGLFSLAQALSLLPEDWQVEGRDSLSIRGTLKHDGTWRVDSQWNCDRLSFQSPDMAQAGEKIAFDLRMAAAGDLNRPVVTASVQGLAEQGGFLYDRIYLDLNRNSLQVQVQGNYDFSRHSADLARFKVVLKDLLSLEAQGSLADPAVQSPWHLFVRLPRTRVEPLFEFFFKEPLKQQMPSLAELDLEGEVLAEMEFQKAPEGWRLIGQCSLNGGEILGKGFRIQGIDLDLPLWGEAFRAPAEPPFRGRSTHFPSVKQEGALSIRSISLPHVPEQPFAADIRISPNLVALIPQDSFKVPGGDIELGPLLLKGLFSVTPSLATRAALGRIDLAPFLLELGLPSVPGSIQGKLDPLEFDGRNIRTKGDLTVRAYRGEVVLSNLGGSGIGTATPTFLLDARWKDLHLGELTEGTPFGKVEGILKGHVRNLEMVWGEPQRFDLFMETVKTQEVPQKISVRAVENIARIGGSASPFIGLAGAFTSFFNEFPYDKIAIQATLENDVFTIDGPLKEGDKVYLVKRSGLSGVNVVNQDPGRRISFKDMVKRIKRVGSAQQGSQDQEESPKSENLN